MIEIRQKLFKEIEDSSKKIFQNKLKIAETIENATTDKKISYLITDNPSTFYNSDQMYIDFLQQNLDRNIYKEFDFFKAAINKMKGKDHKAKL